jgi:hypothetical protein
MRLRHVRLIPYFPVLCAASDACDAMREARHARSRRALSGARACFGAVIANGTGSTISELVLALWFRMVLKRFYSGARVVLQGCDKRVEQAERNVTKTVQGL